MCMIDDCERVESLSAIYRTARKQHTCAECGRVILAGERYRYESFIDDSGFTTHKFCGHCDVIRQWLNDECGGFVYTMLAEDIRDHASEGTYGFGVLRLAAGIKRHWARKDGRMWPMPKMPPLTFQGATP